MRVPSATAAATACLIVGVLYGCGLRLQECLELRVKDVDFERGAIIVREGKGRKDRAVMLPQRLIPDLRTQISRARLLWSTDQAEGRGGVTGNR